MHMIEHFYFRLLHQDIDRKIIQCRSIHIMASILLIVYALQFIKDYQEQWMLLLIGIPPALVIIFFSIFKKNIITEVNNNRIFRILELGLLVMAFLHFFKENEYPAFILYFVFSIFLFIIFYIENRVFSKQFIDVKSNGIQIALPTHDKKIDWQQVKNIVVRENYITIETKEEKYLQYPIFNSLTENEYEQFILFCSKNISI